MILRDPNNLRVEVIFTSARPQSIYLQHLLQIAVQKPLLAQRCNGTISF